MGEFRIGYIVKYCELVVYLNKWRSNCFEMYILESLFVFEIMFGGLI